MKEVTIVFPRNREAGEILLAMKKVRFGAGKYNGMGGKIEAGETVRDAALRETFEEVGITIDPSDLIAAADITFDFPENHEWDHHCYVFVADVWTGEPQESDEMAPESFTIDSLPLDRMWVSDRLWLPLVLAGKKLTGTVTLSSDGKTVINSDLKKVEMLSF